MKVELGNSRFLYQCCDVHSENWQLVDGQLMSFIEKHPKLNLRSDQTVLYFFDDNQSEYWVSREIVGYPTGLPDTYQVEDFSGGECLQVLCSKNWFELTMEELLSLGRRNKAEAESAGEKLAPTWRVVIDWQQEAPKLWFNYFFLI